MMFHAYLARSNPTKMDGNRQQMISQPVATKNAKYATNINIKHCICCFQPLTYSHGLGPRDSPHCASSSKHWKSSSLCLAKSSSTWVQQRSVNRKRISTSILSTRWLHVAHGNWRNQLFKIQRQTNECFSVPHETKLSFLALPRPLFQVLCMSSQNWHETMRAHSSMLLFQFTPTVSLAKQIKASVW